MKETSNASLVKSGDTRLEDLAIKLQAQLLLRFENLKKVRIREIPGTEHLRPRSRDLLACLAAPCGENIEICEPLIQFFKHRECFIHEPLPPPESAVLAALFVEIHQTAYSGLVLTKDLTTKVNSLLESSGQPFRLQPRKVGAVMATLGFSWKKRTNTGWTILLDHADQVTAHQLVERRGIDCNLGRFLRMDPRSCALCQEEPVRQNAQAEVTGDAGTPHPSAS